MTKIVFALAGLAVCLIGAFIGGGLPFEKAFDTLRGFGAGTDEDWKPIVKAFKHRSRISAMLLTVGTALQIYGAL